LDFQARITATPSISGCRCRFALEVFKRSGNKVESQWTGERLDRTNAFAVRIGPSVRIRNGQGEWQQAYQNLDAFDSMMTHCADPTTPSNSLMLRERMGTGGFTIICARSRCACTQPQIGTYTPVLRVTDRICGGVANHPRDRCRRAHGCRLADAFPGARVERERHRRIFELEMHQHGLLRPLKAAELSDGTLRYLLLVAALLSPRPRALMILNEPETSLPSDLMPALARLIARHRSGRRPWWFHMPRPRCRARCSRRLARRIILEKQLGETIVRDGAPPDWSWPSR